MMLPTQELALNQFRFYPGPRPAHRELVGPSRNLCSGFYCRILVGWVYVVNLQILHTAASDATTTQDLDDALASILPPKAIVFSFSVTRQRHVWIVSAEPDLPSGTRESDAVSLPPEGSGLPSSSCPWAGHRPRSFIRLPLHRMNVNHPGRYPLWSHPATIREPPACHAGALPVAP